MPLDQPFEAVIEKRKQQIDGDRLRRQFAQARAQGFKLALTLWFDNRSV